MTPDIGSVAVAGWIGSSNIGDELIFREIKRKLFQRGANPTAISIDASSTRADHRCDSIEHGGPGDSWALLRSLGAMSSLILGGGGLIQSETSPWNLPFHLSRVWSARARHLPWAGIGLGVGSMYGALGRTFVAATMRSAIGTTVRDEASATALRAIGVERVVVAADPVICADVETSSAHERIAVSLRRHNRGGRKTARSQSESDLDMSWVQSTATALDVLSAAWGLPIRFVAFQPDRDDVIHRAVADRMLSPFSFAPSSFDTVLDEVASSTFVVAMRYHAAIGALLGGVPGLLVDYSPKMRDLAADVGDGLQVISSEFLDADDLVHRLHTAERHASVLPDALSALRARETANGRMIDRLLETA